MNIYSFFIKGNCFVIYFLFWLTFKDGALDTLQDNFMEKGAVQCGFCTFGMIFTAKAFLDRQAKPLKN